MNLPESLRTRLEERVGSLVRNVRPIGGGCIANASRVDTGAGYFFVKWGTGAVADTFGPEAAGLRELRQAATILRIPEVVFESSGDDIEPGFLVLEWIEQGVPGPEFWREFGHGLARLHRQEGGAYGFPIDNFIGRLPQHNKPEDTWPAFFRACRIEPQVAIARQNGRWRHTWDASLDRLYVVLEDLLPALPEKSTLHGDLWSGNFMVASDGVAALIDPAAYFGHRETDLAMAELFGGFDPEFFDNYRNEWPLEPGYPDRRLIYQLYHLINHLNHFGESYAASVDRILRRFAGR